MEFAEIICPNCGEPFEVAMPSPDEMPAEFDYDCEVCCRPMLIVFTAEAIYAKSLAGGQVEPASGNFVFGVAEGYLIEDGRITAPLRGATLVGNGIDILMKIDLIAGDFDVKTGICGKDGQGVPVGTGQATLRIAEMTVGGTG